MPYVVQELHPGIYNVTLTVGSEAEDAPSIDYLQFKTTDATTVDPSNMTEADIPDNDMRNLQQYKYVSDDDVYSYKSYATGGDFSAPRGMKLKYDEVENGSKYYVQVAESEAGLANAAVRESNQKYYYFQNAKLATKYYYRAAASEAGLAPVATYSGATIGTTTTTMSLQACMALLMPTQLRPRSINVLASSNRSIKN